MAPLATGSLVALAVGEGLRSDEALGENYAVPALRVASACGPLARSVACLRLHVVGGWSVSIGSNCGLAALIPKRPFGCTRRGRGPFD